MSANDEETTNTTDEPVVVRDRRKVDPVTGNVRTHATETDLSGGVAGNADAVPGAAGAGAAGSAGAGSAGAGSELGEVQQELADRTADLQRVQAEYANYRKRVDRDRDAVTTGAKAAVVAELLPTLDDLERAEAHGDLTGAFKAVADKLHSGLAQAGLESFGGEGEVFDPSVHEAVQHTTSSEVDQPTVTAVLRRGYHIGGRIVRAAMVAVTENDSAPAEVPGEAVPADTEQQAAGGEHERP